MLCASLGLAGAASASEPYPSKPIKVLVPYAPGGATDYAARLLTEKARVALGQNIIIENKVGAGGMVAIEEMARSKPDGYTLMIGNVTTNAITPVIAAKRFTINYERDVEPVARLLVTPSTLSVNADFPPRDFKEFLDYTRKNPGKVRYSSTGIASFPHFDMEVLARRAGLDMIHIPYKGGAGEFIKGLVSGDVHVGGMSTPLALSLSKAGKIRVLAVNTEKRLDPFPDVPTFTEHGFPGQGTLNWSALFAPAGTPPDVIEKLHKVFTEAVNDPFVAQSTEKTGTFIFPIESPAATKAWLKDEIAKWRRTVAEVKIEMN
jgi:tripartite-type tricarboxylate transporter receptor subunit TctC